VVASGMHDLEEHFRTKLHERNFEMKKGASIKSFFAQPKQEDDNVISKKNEIKFQKCK